MNKQRKGGGASRKSASRGKTPNNTGAKKSAANSGDEKKVSARDKRKYIDFKQRVKKGDPLPNFKSDTIRLNKYLSNAGVCSRREADVLIQTGVVSVNGKVITELGYRVSPTDRIQYDGETIQAETKRYVLLNKPKGFVTALEDPRGRKTVMSLVKKACRERIYPVDKLEKDGTGLLLFSNDGDLVKKLTHPRSKTSKLYHVEVNKPVQKEHLQTLLNGIDLEDGRTYFQEAEYVKGGNSHDVGVRLISGKNRVVTRAFEALGYVVTKIDRVEYAGLNKKDLPRGMFRHLSEKEVHFLKMSK